MSSKIGYPPPKNSPPPPFEQGSLGGVAAGSATALATEEKIRHRIEKEEEKTTHADIKTLNTDTPNTTKYQQQEAAVGNDLTQLMNLTNEPKPPKDLIKDIDSIKNKGPFLEQIQTVLHLKGEKLDSSMQRLSHMLHLSEYQSNPMKQLATNLVKAYYEKKSITDSDSMNSNQDHPVSLEKSRNSLADDLKKLLSVDDFQGVQNAIHNVHDLGKYPVLKQIGKVLDDINNKFLPLNQLANDLKILKDMKNGYSGSPFIKLFAILNKKIPVDATQFTPPPSSSPLGLDSKPDLKMKNLKDTEE